jgi:Domain of unknown function (DUF3883)
MINFSDKIREFQNKADTELIAYLMQWWEIDVLADSSTIRLIGTYEKADKPDKNGNEYGFFGNIRSPKGDLLYYPFRLGQVRIYSPHKDHFQNADFLQLEVSLSKQQFREKIKNPFALNLDRVLGNASLRFLDRIDKEQFIKVIFNDTGNTLRDAKNTSNALKKIAGDLYTETERFIFELLQNADDIPNEKKEVDVIFRLLSENLLFLHNGKPFDKNDVDSISSIGDSTKRKDAEKTGYKGIGFKSVFTDAETVLIRSDNFSFSFDKYSPLYDGKNIDEIPWEIKPIWTEHYRYPREVKECEDFFKFPVAFDLEVTEQKIKIYKSQIQQLFSEPRFILFLRHVKTIQIVGLEHEVKIQKVKKGNRFELLNNNIPINEWIINDFDFVVTDEIREGMANDKIVPEKLKEIQKSKLSFACQVTEDKITSIASEKSYLFTYLPTNVNDYKFPFLVNADFLTTANRQSIHVKNIWNLYLFEQIGYLCFEWISQIAQNEDLRFTLTNLIPSRFSNTVEPIQINFNKGFDKAIQEIAFLPNPSGNLCKVSEALLDLTGFSEIVGNELFIQLVNPSKKLISNKLENKTKLLGLQGISYFGTDELKKLFSNASFQQAISPQLLLEILKFLKTNKYNFSDIPLVLCEKSDKGLYFPSSLYFQTNEDDKNLLTFQSTYFLHPTINEFADTDTDFKAWLKSLGVLEFLGQGFIRKFVLDHSSTINTQLSIKSINFDFWRFIFKYSHLLLETEIAQLKNYYVFDINDAPVGNITACYLSDFYREVGDASVQQIAIDLGLTDFTFISTAYCINNNDKSKWRKLFYNVGLKHSQNVRIFKDKVIPFIKSGKMNVNNYLKIAKFVFEIFSENRSTFDSNELGNFKVLTTNGTLQSVSYCILSDDYTGDLRLNTVLPEFQLSNLVHSVYLQQINNNRQSWKEFFLKLNSNIELNSTDIVKKKVDIIANNPTLVTRQNVQSIWRTIISFKDELLKTHKEQLKKVPILLKNGAITSLSQNNCYFPKEYNPLTDTETLLSGLYSFFISPIFLQWDNSIKSFLSNLGVSESIFYSFYSSNKWYYYALHTEHLPNFNFAVKFWQYVITNRSTIGEEYLKSLSNSIKDKPFIPCLDGQVRLSSAVHTYKLKDFVNDVSFTCIIDFNTDIELILGLQQRLTFSKCFQLLNEIASIGNKNDKRIKQIYDDLLHRFTTENITLNNSIISVFKQNGNLLTNNGTFQSVKNLYYQDVTASYLPLEESDKIIQRFGSKEDWKKFEILLSSLGLQKITVSDFALDNQSSAFEAPELTKTINNSIGEFAQKIDTVNYQTIEKRLKNRFNTLKIYYSSNLKMSCSKLNYSPTVPNYYDPIQNIIYYCGNWNSISNSKLIDYLFKSFDISESQISKDEFVSILLSNIPTSKSNTWQERPPETLKPDGDTGRFGEELVYRELVQKFGKNRVKWLNEGGETYSKYDFEILNSNNSIMFYIDAKATTTNEISGDTVPIYIRQSEWQFMQECDNNYIIARVYNAKSSNAYTKYLKLGLQNLHEIEL